MAEIMAIVLGIFKFWDETVWFIKMLQGTPAERIQRAIADVHASFEKSKETKGDTSDIEKVIAGS